MFDTDIPVPNSGNGKRKYDLEGMKIGDSKFFIPEKSKSTYSLRTALVNSASMQNKGGKYSTKKIIEDETEGVRIWRVE